MDICPFSFISETNLCAAIIVSLVFCGVNEQPPTTLDNSSTFEIVPLCATHKSRTLSGCALSILLFPIVEYLTCPIAEADEYSIEIFLNSEAEEETKPNFFNGDLFGTAIPHASWPLC